jgi:3-phosphoinositide dependent protein kinase-1
MHHACIEKEVLSYLRHQGIIKLFTSFEDENKLYYSLELLNDGNLLEYMNSNIIILIKSKISMIK